MMMGYFCFVFNETIEYRISSNTSKQIWVKFACSKSRMVGSIYIPIGVYEVLRAMARHFCKFNKKGQILCPNLQHGIIFIPGSRSTEFSEQCLVANVGINDEVVGADTFPRKMCSQAIQWHMIPLHFGSKRSFWNFGSTCSTSVVVGWGLASFIHHVS